MEGSAEVGDRVNSATGGQFENSTVIARRALSAAQNAAGGTQNQTDVIETNLTETHLALRAHSRHGTLVPVRGGG
jgi:hypothetical protein